jgi:hypothetical protein
LCCQFTFFCCFAFASFSSCVSSSKDVDTGFDFGCGIGVGGGPGPLLVVLEEVDVHQKAPKIRPADLLMLVLVSFL